MGTIQPATTFTQLTETDAREVVAWHYPPPSVLLSCGLHPAWCGRGLGRSLVAHAVERTASEHPGSDLALDVRPFNTRAIRLYAGFGFTAHGQTTDAPTPLIRMIRRGR